MRPPRGYRFDPNELELMQYLFDKVSGCLNPGQGVIIDGVDVYASSPDLLSAMLGFSDGDGRLFCYTPIKFRKQPHIRDRKTPDGHWKSTDGRSQIKDKVANLVGYVQSFTYCHGKKDSLVSTKWIMKEYTHTDCYQNVALCVIYSSLNRYNKPKKEKSFSSTHGPNISHSIGVMSGCSGSETMDGIGGAPFMEDPCLLIQNQSSLCYNASSSKDDFSIFSTSAQGSQSTNGISFSYNSISAGAGLGSENVYGSGGACFGNDPFLFNCQELSPISGAIEVSAAEHPGLPDDGDDTML